MTDLGSANVIRLHAGSDESLPKLMALAVALMEHAETLTGNPLTGKECAAVRTLCADLRKSLNQVEADLQSTAPKKAGGPE